MALAAFGGSNNAPEAAHEPQNAAGHGTTIGGAPAVDEQQAAAKSAQFDAKPDTVRVCTTSAADGWSVTEWRVPALAVFEHAGILLGGIRDKWDRDSYRAETVDCSAALVTTEEAFLRGRAPAPNRA